VENGKTTDFTDFIDRAAKRRQPGAPLSLPPNTVKLKLLRMRRAGQAKRGLARAT